jgi:hypothetical protein
MSLKLRDMAVSLECGLRRVCCFVTDEPVSLQCPSAGDPVRAQEVCDRRRYDLVVVWTDLLVESGNQVIQSRMNFRSVLRLRRSSDIL